MFQALFKNKLKIENEVSSLQSRYLDLLKVYKEDNNSTEDEISVIKEKLSEKHENVKNVLTNYQLLLQQHQKLVNDNKAAQELALVLHSELDNLFSNLGIEYVNQTRKTQLSDDQEETNTGAFKCEEINEGDKENINY